MYLRARIGPIGRVAGQTAKILLVRQRSNLHNHAMRWFVRSFYMPGLT